MMEHPGGKGSVQGLWQSDAHAELSLAETRGGMLVGIYRILGAAGTAQHPLSGHVVAGHVAFSVAFPDRRTIATWSGSLVSDSDGARLELVRRVIGDGASPDVSEIYRRAAGDASPGLPLPVGPPEARGADSSAG